MDSQFYQNILYPFQERILQAIAGLDTGFYLTGGTAASRGYLNHRYSDDLDFFVNDDDRFGLWVDRIVTELQGNHLWQTRVLQRDPRFSRLVLHQNETALQIDLVNDVRSRVGAAYQHPLLGTIDTAENILANKVTALIDREQPKDLADIWGFCTKMALSLESAIEGADSKAAGIFPADLARVLCSATADDWRLIRWISAPDVKQFLTDLRRIGEELIL
ncbi:MAG: nucleotidyl transferase AbiEii/AbiGii toxin family protein [Caldilineaceae bacterium]